MFGGGRGMTTIARELRRRPGIRLTLLVNAYDDGRSTGALRTAIPGLPGPSDFRKNLASLTEQSAVAELLEYRFPPGVDLEPLCAPLDPSLRGYLARALERLPDFDFADCALGNLILAGAFLECGDFNLAVERLARLLGVRVLNVTAPEPRTLGALKKDGQILNSEAEVSGPQSAVPLEALFLWERPLTPAELQQAAALDQPARLAMLRSLERPIDLSGPAGEALARARVIVYGPGTQHSSLLPSYQTRGLPEALRASPAELRLFVANLEPDHDIPGATAWELVERAMARLGAGSVSHLLYHRGSLPLGEEVAGVQLVAEEFADPAQPAVHSGSAVAERLLRLLP